MPDYTIFQLGDQASTISLGNAINQQQHRKVLSMQQWLLRNKFPGMLDIIVAYCSVTLRYDLYSLMLYLQGRSGFQFVKEHLQRAYDQCSDIHQNSAEIKKIPVCYDYNFSYDSQIICQRNNITHDQMVELHVQKAYQVFMIGFLPGFAYMGEVDKLIAVPRKEKPRSRVEAGSVGIAGTQTGIYPVDSPGGWQIIGRTPLVMFDKNANPPAKLEPGDQVQFYPITRKEFDEYSRDK